MINENSLRFFFFFFFFVLRVYPIKNIHSDYNVLNSFETIHICVVVPPTQYTVRFIYFILLLFLGFAFLNYIFSNYVKCLHDLIGKFIKQDIVRKV